MLKNPSCDFKPVSLKNNIFYVGLSNLKWIQRLHRNVCIVYCSKLLLEIPQIRGVFLESFYDITLAAEFIPPKSYVDSIY